MVTVYDNTAPLTEAEERDLCALMLRDCLRWWADARFWRGLF